VKILNAKDAKVREGKPKKQKEIMKQNKLDIATMSRGPPFLGF